MDRKKIISICSGILLFFFFFDLIFVEHQGTYWWQKLAGVNIIIGLAGAFILIYTAKTLGKLFIQRSENYYYGGEDDVK